MTAPEHPTARRTGRILSLGFPMPGPRVDNYNFLNAPSFFDYDAIVVDPHALSTLIEQTLAGTVEPTTFTGHPVRNEPAAADDVALRDVLLRRRDETRLLLEQDGVVVAFAHPPTLHRNIAAGGALDDYFWLPAAEGVAYDSPILVPGEGSAAHVVDFQHPTAPFVLGQLANLAYRAHFAVELIPGFPSRGAVVARSKGGAAIGVELPAPNGRIVFLPALKTIPSGDPRYAMSDTLQACIRRMLGAMAEGREPYWMRAIPEPPGLNERAAAVQAAESALNETQRALDAARASHDDLARYRALLWQEGAAGLEPAVIDALKLIGCDVYAGNPDEIEIRAVRVSAVLEVDAAEGEVGLAAHYRLRQRIERAIERRSAAPRGLVFINGYRLKSPSERPQQASPALRTAAESLRYCVATTSSLYDAVLANLNGDDEAVAAYRSSLVTHDGLLT